MITLLIEDVEVDVLQTEQIVTEYSVAPIGDISKRTGARSIQFKLPRTAKNRAIFEASELPISTSAKPYQRLKARLYVDGVDMNILFATLESVKDYYFIRVYGSNVDFFNIIKDGKLADLNLNDLNHHWDFLTVRNSRLNTDGYIYPLINWNVGDVVGNTAREQVSRLLVNVYAETLLQRICSQNGYTLNNLLLNDSDYTYSKIVVPAGSVDYRRNTNSERYKGAVYNMDEMVFFGSPFLPFEHNQLLSERETFFSNQNPPYKTPNSLIGGGLLYFADKIRLDWTLDLKLYNTNAGNRTLVIRALTRKAITTGAADIIQTFSIIIPPTGAITPFETQISGSYILSGYDIGDVDVEFAAPSISFSYNMPFNCYALQNDCIFTILDTTEIIEDETPDVNGREISNEEVNSIRYNAGNIGNVLPEQFNYCTPDSVLPDLKQSDFLKNFLQLHGAIVQVNEQTKVVTIAKFEQVLNNLSSAVDWTGKLDFIEEYETKFQLDYAQNNYLRYKDEDGVIKPEGTDSNLTVADENLEFEKDFITLDFGATESDVWFTNGNNAFNYNTPNIAVLVDGLVEETTEPRLLYLKQIDGYTHTYRDGASQFDVNTSAPIAWFIDADFTHSLGFGSDLYERYYSFLEGILDRTKVIEAKIRLNTSDIAQLDFLKPVYIGELDAHFYVSKVKFDYTSNASSIVELVKLL